MSGLTVPYVALAAGEAKADARQATYKSAYFEIKYPAAVKTRVLDAAKAKASSTAKDKSCTRIYLDFLATDASIHWVIGMKYKSDAALQQYKALNVKFKASFRQHAD